MPAYTFDVKIMACFTVEAESQAAAEAILRETVDCATIDCGALPNGQLLTGEGSIDGELDLSQIDGEFVE